MRIIPEKVYGPEEIEKNLHSLWGEILDYLSYFLIVFVSVSIVYVGIRNYVFDVIKISGKSMFPTYNDGDLIYIDILSKNFSSIRRGDVIILQAPKECEPKEALFIKRVVGLPGESVIFDKGNVYIKNSEFPDGVKLIEEYIPSEAKTYKNIFTASPKLEEPILEKNKFYVMGDNRGGSLDSRRCGPIDSSRILGKEVFRAIPAEKQGFFKLPTYNIPDYDIKT